VLKKAGTVVAVITASMLAMSPLALAGSRGGVDVTDQENEQESDQGNGILNGNNILSGNAIQVCSVNANALNNVLGALLASSDVDQEADTEQENGDCKNKATAVGQSTVQNAENENN